MFGMSKPILAPIREHKVLLQALCSSALMEASDAVSQLITSPPAIAAVPLSLNTRPIFSAVLLKASAGPNVATGWAVEAQNRSLSLGKHWENLL